MSHSERPTRYRCRVTGLQDLTHDIRLIRLALESGGPLTFRAGQFVRLGFADLPFTDYSIANRPGEPDLEFFIRETNPSGVSHYATSVLSLGEIVDLQGPYGDCYLREEHQGPVLAMAVGSGLGPVKSIIETLLAGPGQAPVHLYFGVGGERDLFLSTHFRQLAETHPRLRYVPAIEQSGAEGQSDGQSWRNGLITDLVAQDFQSLAGFKAYLAGPPPLIEAATEVLLSLGLPSGDLHTDAFHAMDVIPSREGPTEI